MSLTIVKALTKTFPGINPYLAALGDRQTASQLGILHIHVFDEGAIQYFYCHVSILLIIGLDQHLQGLYLKVTNSE